MGDIGSLEIITGCMFSGKTEELIRRIERCDIARVPYFVFKPRLDTRYAKTAIVTNDKRRRVKAIPIRRAEQMLKYIQGSGVVAVDEAQFFDPAIVDVVRYLAHDQGRRVIVAALLTDFRGDPFHFKKSERHVGEFLVHGEWTKLYAVCDYEHGGEKCGAQAEMTQRLNLDGTPASYYSPLIVLGGKKKHKHKFRYEARCRKDHEVPDRPTGI